MSSHKFSILQTLSKLLKYYFELTGGILMKMKATAVKNIEIQQLVEKVAKFKVNFDDVIRMKFLEQSAKYLGAYVENNSNSLLNEHSIS